MNTWLVVLGIAAACGVLYLLLRRVATTYFNYRDSSVITCPENQQTAGVQVDAAHAAASALYGKPELRLMECSRWPEKENCGQECLHQISTRPESCMVRSVFSSWYQDKTCSICGKRLGPADWLEQKPVLRAPDGKTLELSSVPAEKLHEVLASHQAACWDCHIAETFRREHPDRVIDRTWKNNASPTIH